MPRNPALEPEPDPVVIEVEHVESMGVRYSERGSCLWEVLRRLWVWCEGDVVNYKAEI